MAPGLGFDQQYSSGFEEPFQTPPMESLSFNSSFGSSMWIYDLVLNADTSESNASYLPDASIASVTTMSQSGELLESIYQGISHQPEDLWDYASLEVPEKETVCQELHNSWPEADTSIEMETSQQRNDYSQPPQVPDEPSSSKVDEDSVRIIRLQPKRGNQHPKPRRRTQSIRCNWVGPDTCFKTFTKSQDMRRHIREQHEKFAYRCNLCNIYTKTRLERLRSHLEQGCNGIKITKEERMIMIGHLFTRVRSEGPRRRRRQPKDSLDSVNGWVQPGPSPSYA